MDFRETVQERLRETHQRPADLLARLGSKVGKQSLYDWLGGRSGAINSDSLAAILDALGLTVIPRSELDHLRDRERIVQEATTRIEAIARRVEDSVKRSQVPSNFRPVASAHPPIEVTRDKSK